MTQSAHDLLTSGDGKLSLHYFSIEGVAEQVRITLSVAGIPFDDIRVPFSEWQTKKATTKYGQLPEMILPNGQLITESMAMLRLAGEADPEGKLYPADVGKRLQIEEALGLTADLSRAWRPALYIGMRPEKLGHPKSADWAKEEKDATIKKLREAFLAEELPRYMGYYADLIKEAGGNAFLLGEDLTIADIAAYQGLNYYRKGVADYVPADCLDPYPDVVAFLKRVEEQPKVAAYKASKA
ncbi:glutathione S-transferase [Skeletonema marinoi]|uniref:Glutathione S-transferase n=1 Tax=Skeletonema marinoi TaxID=267567 RepID=A0AAD9DBW4_9STRA|nr:glutathione S-transferase [Skeletonema marinoi]|mmetsp:Transcript_29178/g.49755  ORF Transcript_29178/g.49755 Transcript_29178/m.49755 type:complete len:240 (+) Transcript_29178:115-834(+)